MDEEQVVSSNIRGEESFDPAVRPTTLAEIIGQTRIKENLEVQIGAARERGEPLDHTLFYGPPGLGKTTFAHVLAREMGVAIKVTSGPGIERAGGLAAIPPNLQP